MVADGTTRLTERFDRALDYATLVHGGQVRKKTSIPYIAHLLAVSATILEYGGSEDLAIAGLLHDAVEDQGGPPRLDDIRNRFGQKVAKIVAACSDSMANTSAGELKAPYKQRKLKYIRSLERKDTDTLLVSLCDKVHNARSILRDLRKREVGDVVWTRFSSGSREKTLWYYAELAEAFKRLMPGHQLAEELAEIVAILKRSKPSGRGAASRTGDRGTWPRTPHRSLTPEQTENARRIRNRVRVDDKPYESTYQAFRALRLPVGQHIRFRGDLKRAKRLPFTYKGRTYRFAIVD